MIRRAVMADADGLAELMRRTYIAAYVDEMDSAELRVHVDENLSDQSVIEMLGEDVFLLSMQANECIGFFQTGRVSAAYAPHIGGLDVGDSDLEIRRAYVADGWQSRGIGTELMRRVLADLHMPAPSRVLLTVWETNLRAQAFYRKFDFAYAGKIPGINSAGELAGYEHIMVRQP